MRLSKAEQLLNTLTIKELSQFEDFLKRDKKSRLLKMTQWLTTDVKRRGDENLRPELFEFLFDQAYDKKKSYLLRNEFRLLKEQLHLFLVETQIQKEVRENDQIFRFYLLNALRERNGLELVKQENKSSFEDLLTRINYFLSFSLNSLDINPYMQFIQKDEDVLKQSDEINNARLKYLCGFFIVGQQQYFFNQAFIDHFRYPFSIYHTQYNWDLPMRLNPEADRTEYLLFKAISYLFPLDKQVTMLRECLDFGAREVKKGSDYFLGEMKYCLMELASIFIRRKDLGVVRKHYEDLLALPIPQDDLYRLATILNFAGLLLDIGEPQTALDLLNKEEVNFRSYQKYTLRLNYLRITTYALLKDIEGMTALLPMSFSDIEPDDKYFYRMFFAIRAWLSDMPDEAAREIDNLLNVLQKGKQPDFDIRPVARMLRSFFRSASLPVKPQLQKLWEEMEQYSLETSPEYHSYLPFFWLKKKMESCFSK